MQCEIKSNHWIVYLCSAWAQGRFSWLTENWKIIFLSRERHWRPLTNRIPQEKSCRKDFTPKTQLSLMATEFHCCHSRHYITMYTKTLWILYKAAKSNMIWWQWLYWWFLDSLSQWRSSMKFEWKKICWANWWKCNAGIFESSETLTFFMNFLKYFLTHC